VAVHALGAAAWWIGTEALRGAGAADSLDEARRAIRVLLGLWIATGVVTAGAALGVHQAMAAATRRRARAVRNSARVLARQFESAIRGEPSNPTELAPGLEPVVGAIEQVKSSLERIRDTLRFERHRARFSHDLVEALELSENEREVCTTAARAAEIAFPGCTFQLLLADNSHARLTSQLAATPARCSPEGPTGCPALRRSRTMMHAPDGGIARCPRLERCAESVACAAISVRGSSVGVAQLVGRTVDAGALETLTGMSFSLGARLGVVRTLGERELAAATDALTGLANRRAMNERLASLDQRAQPYAILSADLDHFKRLNDTFGHEVGDRCLRVFAQVLRDASRGGDLACRPGGEEFALVLVGADCDGAAAAGERVHALLAEATRRAGVPFTVSLGIAAYPMHGAGAEEILRAADAALYAAKDAGRNCTRAFSLATVSPIASSAA
jgi:diguanylate cyclase (GGDEF)-like protein